MSSTNHTTNYNLPQFVGSDKPAWLGDINPAFGAIDTAMHNNATAAAQASTDAGNAATAAASAATAAADAATAAGTAQTTANNAVAGLSETNTKLNAFVTTMTINDFETCNVTLSGTNTKLRLTLAQSEDGGIFKIYGVTQISNNSGSAINPFGAIRNASGHIKTGLYLKTAPTEAFAMAAVGMEFTKGGSAILNNSEINVFVEADGEITLDYWGSSSIANNQAHYLYLPACIYFNTNFGDTPEQQ